MSRYEENDAESRRTSKGKRTPAVKTRSTVIQRTAADDLRRGGELGFGGGRISNRQSFGPIYPAGTVASASQEGVAKVISNTAEEKNQFQGLNQRLAGYIENAKFTDAQLKMLASQLEAEKKKKCFDPTEMKEYYENELAEYRDVVKKLNEEKAESDAERADLLDRFEDEKEANAQRETELRIKAECERDAIEDKAEFEIEILKAQIKELNEMLTTDTVQFDMQNEMKGRIQDVIKEYQQNYQDAMDKLKSEYENKYQIQMQQLQGQDRKENAQIAKLQNEITKLRNAKSDVPKVSELMARIKALEAEKAHLKEIYDTECKEHDYDNDKKDGEIAELRAEMEGIQRHLQQLEHSNYALKNEIETYNKLLTAEEKSLGGRTRERS